MENNQFVSYKNVQSNIDLNYIFLLPDIMIMDTYSNPYSNISLNIPPGEGFLDLYLLQSNIENESQENTITNEQPVKQYTDTKQYDDKRAYVKHWLMSNENLTNEQASALTGVWWAESRLNPSIHEIGKEKNPYAGKGIALWTGKQRLKHAEDIYKQLFGKSKSIKQMTLEELLKVAVTEFKERGTWQQFVNAKDLKTATDIVWRGYENGGNSLASYELMKKTYGKAFNKQWSDRFRFALEISKM